MPALQVVDTRAVIDGQRSPPVASSVASPVPALLRPQTEPTEPDDAVLYQAGPPPPPPPSFLTAHLGLLGAVRQCVPPLGILLGGHGDPPPQALAPYDGLPAVVGLYPSAAPRLRLGRHMTLTLTEKHVKSMFLFGFYMVLYVFMWVFCACI